MGVEINRITRKRAYQHISDKFKVLYLIEVLNYIKDLGG